MGEIDELQQPVHHAVTERYERIDCPEGEAVDDLLKKFVHSYPD